MVRGKGRPPIVEKSPHRATCSQDKQWPIRIHTAPHSYAAPLLSSIEGPCNKVGTKGSGRSTNRSSPDTTIVGDWAFGKFPGG